MIQKNIPRYIVALLCVVIALGAVNAIAANVSITSRHNLDEQETPLPSINNKKPAECTMTITSLVVCTGGVCDGTNANELFLGTTGSDIISGRGGNDCILGGDGNDDIRGNNGGDVCFGGLGNDTFTKCEKIIDP